MMLVYRLHLAILRRPTEDLWYACNAGKKSISLFNPYVLCSGNKCSASVHDFMFLSDVFISVISVE